MLNKLLATGALIITGFWGNGVIALERQTVADTTAASTVTPVMVSQGHSTVLNFVNGQYVQSVWIDNPNVLGVATDRPLCGSGGDSNGCGNASSIRLTSLNGSLGLPGRGYASNGGTTTLVTINTVGNQGAIPYQFEVTTNVPSSPVSMVVIESTSVQSESDRPDLSVLTSRIDIEKVRAGMEAAISSGQADVDSDAWRSLESFLMLVERGQSVAGAMRISAVPVRLLNALQSMGAEKTTATEDSSIEI